MREIEYRKDGSLRLSFENIRASHECVMSGEPGNGLVVGYDKKGKRRKVGRLSPGSYASDAVWSVDGCDAALAWDKEGWDAAWWVDGELVERRSGVMYPSVLDWMKVEAFFLEHGRLPF